MDIKEYYMDKEGLIFHVKSERDRTIVYVVAVDMQDGWHCTCEDYQFRKHKCKHIKNVIKYIQKKYPILYDKYNELDVYVNIKKIN